MPSSFTQEDGPMEKTFEEFSLYESIYKTSDPWGRTIFDLRAVIRTTLIGVHKIKLHTKYQRPGPSSFRQEKF